MNVRSSFPLVAILALLGATCSVAGIELAPPFTDHAVLQREATVPVWGHADPGEKITVSFHGQIVHSTADAKGHWTVRLKPMPADANGADLSINGKTSVILHDVVIGEVWLASGQSNMEWPLNRTRDSSAEIARANSPLIRHLRVDHIPSDTPTDTVKTSGWKVSSSDTAGDFTAVGYFFARELSAKLHVPVGIIHSSWGGTPIESWIGESILKTSKAWPRFEKEWEEAVKVFPQKKADYAALDAAWRKADEESRSTGKPNPLPWPHPPVGPGTAYAPGGLFNGMILPMAPYALRGALWYQGESNVGRAGEYSELLPALISNWRKTWGQKEYAFLVVQLPNYTDHNPTGRNWAELREAQTAALPLPGASVAVTIDGDEPDNLHSTNKKPVGDRLAFAAEANVYKIPNVEGSGPQFLSAKREGGAIRVQFSHAKGLNAKTNPAGGFEIAGEDRIFHPASAIIENETVVVSSPEVKDPAAVRYAFTNAPSASLYNAAGLPAGPFRSDTW